MPLVILNSRNLNLKPLNLFLSLRAIYVDLNFLRQTFSPHFDLTQILRVLDLRRGLHAFHRIHIPPLTSWSSKNSSDADRSSPFTNNHDVYICFGVHTNSRREHPCSPISRTALALLPPYNLKYAVRPLFPTCPRLSNSPASSLVHSIVLQSNSTLHFNGASSPILHDPYSSSVVLNCFFCRSVRLWVTRW